MSTCKPTCQFLRDAHAPAEQSLLQGVFRRERMSLAELEEHNESGTVCVLAEADHVSRKHGPCLAPKGEKRA
jgi:hypothetical protein